MGRVPVRLGSGISVAGLPTPNVALLAPKASPSFSGTVSNTGQIFQSSGGGDPSLNAFPYFPAGTTNPLVSSAGEYNDSSSGNILQGAFYTRNSGTRPSVGVWSSSLGPHSFGMNPGAATVGSGTAIGVEIDFGNFTPFTTTTVGSQSAAATTINVASTSGIAASGTFQVTSTSGSQTITYTGITATSFTGCTGGVGTISAGAAVAPLVQGIPVAYALALFSKDNGGPANPNGNYVQISSQSANSQTGSGINFYCGNVGIGPVISTGSLIQTSGPGGSTQAWGLNFIAGTQFNKGALRVPINPGASAVQTYGMSIVVEGGFTSTGAAIQVSGDNASTVANGLVFFGSASPIDVNGALISAAGGGATKHGIDFTGWTFPAGNAINLPSGGHIGLPTSGAGVRIGQASNQLLSFWGATPVVQRSATGTATGFTAGTGSAVLSLSTFTGGSGATAYNISDVVLALKQIGVLAA